MRSTWNRWTRLKNYWQSRQSIERAAATWLSRLTVPNTPEQHHGATNQSGPKWWHYNNTYIWVYLIADCAQIECCQSNLHRQNHKLKWNQYEIHIFISIDNRDLADFKRYCISWLQGCPYIQCMYVYIFAYVFVFSVIVTIRTFLSIGGVHATHSESLLIWFW